MAFSLKVGRPTFTLGIAVLNIVNSFVAPIISQAVPIYGPEIAAAIVALDNAVVVFFATEAAQLPTDKSGATSTVAPA